MKREAPHYLVKLSISSLCFFVVSGHASLNAQVQSDKLDMLPLAVGNHWHYGYRDVEDADAQITYGPVTIAAIYVNRRLGVVRAFFV